MRAVREKPKAEVEDIDNKLHRCYKMKTTSSGEIQRPNHKKKTLPHESGWNFHHSSETSHKCSRKVLWTDESRMNPDEEMEGLKCGCGTISCVKHGGGVNRLTNNQSRDIIVVVIYKENSIKATESQVWQGVDPVRVRPLPARTPHHVLSHRLVGG